MKIVDRIIRASARSQATLPLKDYLGKKLRETYYNAEVLYRIQDKTEPLTLRIRGDAPRRVNLLLPEINFDSLYGGYMAKFNLARKLIDTGYRVRIVVVDPSVYDPARLRAAVRNYAGLEDIFEILEVAYQGDRKETLDVSNGDRFIATTWWTAYLAHHATVQCNGPPFVYLIQEYEPFTFPMGSYYAMAHNSYSFPHVALFSSDLLREHFELNRIGVYDGRHDRTQGEVAGYFENAIVSFEPSELDEALSGGREERGGRRRLLFYARPEAHATRNMFEVAFLALAGAIETGVFDDSWEFHGIGSRHGDIGLPGGRKLRMLGKFGLEEYRRALLNYDVGLSLMYTPHPSLLPLDMASAGLIVVTNTCLNKSEERLRQLSKNLIGAGPHVDGVRRGLEQACRLSGDLRHRRDGARVKWAGSWDQSFNEPLMTRLKSWLE